uniref:GPI mannosyltransferase 2 n=1 Tax=Minutocellus polymorphus TaxID=265543 RepID=A0A7S0ACP6_9STRA|mmetsp:Transcript_10908/g.18164  ORF Transcript_10908/g.18164 Transcript_10908/m.18164 type:complete len:603 (+) Transcript_10908:149-1957(+)
MTVASFHRGTRSEVLRLALISRLIILGGMALSDVLIPDHNPGDDVLRFDLRLGGDGGVGGDRSDGECRRCFCVEGHACDKQWYNKASKGNREQSTRHNPGSKECVGSELSDDFPSTSPPAFLDNFYALILAPNTKWDGARFLSLAVDPAARMPPKTSKKPKERIAGLIFADSEQAHAFFPLFPLCIRYVALLLVQFVPTLLLPSSFEGVVALAALLINTICFTVAALSIYDVTSSLLQRSIEDLKQPEIERASFLVAALFCFNPASVFFTASYSESMFAALTFGGHALAARGLIAVPIIPWTLATYTRSNGTFSSIWILLIGCGKAISQVLYVGSSSANADIPISRKIRRLARIAIPTIIWYAALALIIALPVFYHEKRGYEFHCLESRTELSLPNDHRPVWCSDAEGPHKFSLYGYVQRKYWNVGFLHYYELKQIPNFLLALPVLSLGTIAAVCWIGTSWSHYMSVLHVKKKGAPKKYFVQLFDWALFAFNESASSEVGIIDDTEEVQEGDTPSVKVERALSAPYMLAHYAVLAGFCFVGATIAHVQISTRLICSSCPALYWFLASLCFAGGNNMVWRMKMYLIIFNFLGIVLHPNFLPWT